MSLKNPVAPPGINLGTVRLVAQRLNHHATLPPPLLLLLLQNHNHNYLFLNFMKFEFLTISLLTCTRALYVPITHKQQNFTRGQDSAVGIATHYGLGVPGIEFRYEAIFSAYVQTGPGILPFSCTMSNGSFPWVKRPGRGIDHPPPFSAEVKEGVQL